MRFVLRWPRLSFAMASLIDRTWDVHGRLSARRNWAGASERSAPELDVPHRVTGCREWVLQRRYWSPSVRQPFPRIASGPDPRGLRPPMVLATCNIGALWATGAFIENLPGEMLTLKNGQSPPSRHGEWVDAGADLWSRVAATKRALGTLRGGGFVLATVDGIGDTHVKVSIFNEVLGLRVGAFELSKLTGAPLLPVTARWRGRKLEIVTGDLITPGDRAEMADQFARWLESYMRANPRETLRTLDYLRWLGRKRLKQRPQLGVADLSVLGPGDRTGWEDADAVRREAQGGDDLAGDFGGYLLG